VLHPLAAFGRDEPELCFAKLVVDVLIMLIQDDDSNGEQDIGS
jgi:hypothetical protein